MVDTRQVSLLGQLTGDARCKAEQSLTHLPVRKGRVVVTHGAAADGVFFVLEGEFDMRLYTGKGQELLLERLFPGDVFGHLAVFDGHPRIATVVAATDGMLACMSPASFLAAVQDTAAGALWLASDFATRARELTERIFELATLPVAGRLRCELLRMARRTGLIAEPILLPGEVTHADLAARLGTHREAITRELGDLQRAGIVNLKRRRIEILDVGALEKMAGQPAQPRNQPLPLMAVSGSALS
jgi:CRP/FNR family cyclic AMP-dependent transcriptional regulator